MTDSTRSPNMTALTRFSARYVFGPGMDQPVVRYEGAGTSDRRVPEHRRARIDHRRHRQRGRADRHQRLRRIWHPGRGNAGRFQYTGQAWLRELGMYYYKARMYSPSSAGSCRPIRSGRPTISTSMPILEMIRSIGDPMGTLWIPKKKCAGYADFLHNLLRMAARRGRAFGGGGGPDGGGAVGDPGGEAELARMARHLPRPAFRAFAATSPKPKRAWKTAGPAISTFAGARTVRSSTRS